MKAKLRCAALSMIALVGSVANSQAAPFIVGDVVLTRNSIFESGTDFLYEYTVSGVLVQTIPIDRPNGAQLHAGDLVYDSQGRIELVQADSYISTLDPVTGTWTHTPAPVAISNGSDYDLSIFDNYIYQRQMRMDIDTHHIDTINPSNPGTYSETSVGRDGLLYSILNFGNPRWQVQRTDPLTLQTVGAQLQLKDATGNLIDGRGIAADAEGEMFVADFNGTIYKYDHDGHLLSELVTGATNLLGINLRSDGLLMATSRFGDVIFTNAEFSTLSSFNVGNDNSLGTDIFASFVELPVPEPTTATLLLLGMLGCGWRRRR